MLQMNVIHLNSYIALTIHCTSCCSCFWLTVVVCSRIHATKEEEI